MNHFQNLDFEINDNFKEGESFKNTSTKENRAILVLKTTYMHGPIRGRGPEGGNLLALTEKSRAACQLGKGHARP